MMAEFFIVANSFAAPFFSDESTAYIEAGTPEDSLLGFVGGYSHPCGLYSAICYASADAYYKGQAPLAKWLCNHEIEKRRLTEALDAYSYLGDGPGRFRINDQWHMISNPKEGRIVSIQPGPTRSSEKEGE